MFLGKTSQRRAAYKNISDFSIQHRPIKQLQITTGHLWFSYECA